MPQTKQPEAIFKPYLQHQPMLLPPDLNELIPPHHLVRVVDQAVSRMNLDPVLERYPGGGTSSYHPRMLLKVLIYAYSQRLYSSRQIAKALRENIHFMWLSGGNRPDFRTLNRFRSSRLKGLIQEVFTAVVELLLEAGLVDLKDYFLDGSKIEAAANKYTFVWGRATRTFKSRLQGQVSQLFHQIEAANEAEDQRYGDQDLEELGQGPIDSAMLEAKLQELKVRLCQKPGDQDLKKAAQKIQDDYLPRLKKYEDQEDKLGDRNSYSKTDPDATFMRMKEDYMRNGQLKPGYNLQMGTQKQFILAFSLHQKTTDSEFLIPHLKQLQGRLGRLPDNVIADAGYGSEENYHYLERQGINAYVKYNQFHAEKRRRFTQDPFKKENLPYDEATDSFTCPAGRHLEFIGESDDSTRTGYITHKRLYRCGSCRGCPHRKICHKGRRGRTLEVNPHLQEYRNRARELLDSPAGLDYRSRRPADVEAVFGQIKANRSFRRFKLRGLDKVTVEFGLVALAHNLMKWQVIKDSQEKLTTKQIIITGRAFRPYRIDLN
ncbi:MAG: IS1182 family transposase [bacterium]|nr:IS1182 family transposase [bacterium]